MIVRVPASSANLGPGFDTLGMALSLYAELGAIDGGDVPEGARTIDEHHPASVAFRLAGGEGVLWERSSLPAGRGLGFSGAARVGGAVLARVLVEGRPDVDDDLRAEVLPLVSRLEGHADNAAASLYGGVVATGAGRVVRVPLAVDPAVVVWIPSFVTKTDESRKVLATTVSMDDAVFNVAHVAMLVAALAGGDIDALRDAVGDRLHQPARLAAAAPSAVAMKAAEHAGAWCAWLSGSGPTVAALCSVADAEDVVAALPADGHSKVLRIDHEGTAVEVPYR